MTTSGKVRKVELKEKVMEHIQRRTRHTDALHEAEEDALCRIFAFLLGQSPEILSREKPLEEMADSINLLRLEAHVRCDLSEEITTKDVLGPTNLQDVAKRLDKLEVFGRPEPPNFPKRLYFPSHG